MDPNESQLLNLVGLHLAVENDQDQIQVKGGEGLGRQSDLALIKKPPHCQRSKLIQPSGFQISSSPLKARLLV